MVSQRIVAQDRTGCGDQIVQFTMHDGPDAAFRDVLIDVAKDIAGILDLPPTDRRMIGLLGAAQTPRSFRHDLQTSRDRIEGLAIRRELGGRQGCAEALR